MLLLPALARYDVSFATTNPAQAARDGFPGATLLEDTNRAAPFKALRCAAQVVRAVLRTRPDYVVTTGALPGLFCLAVGRLSGAKTIWIDSVANAEQPSMSGRAARRFASLWLTQWEHLAQDRREYAGSVL